jgi:hypothetical protein
MNEILLTNKTHHCTICGHGPLLSWERAGDGCCKCKETQPITLNEDDVQSAIRAFICACRPELAVGWVIDVRARLIGGAASATAWREKRTEPAQPSMVSAAMANEKGETPGVAAVAAWFDVLEAAQDTLHNVQYPLRAMELPSYPAGGVCGIANLGIALDRIVAAQNALDLVRDQLSHWKAMTEAYGSSSNNPAQTPEGQHPGGCL